MTYPNRPCSQMWATHHLDYSKLISKAIAVPWLVKNNALYQTESRDSSAHPGLWLVHFHWLRVRGINSWIDLKSIDDDQSIGSCSNTVLELRGFYRKEENSSRIAPLSEKRGDCGMYNGIAVLPDRRNVCSSTSSLVTELVQSCALPPRTCQWRGTCANVP